MSDDLAMPSPAPAPAPALRVLGPPALHGPDGEPITFRTRKHFALLIYLALEPQTHRREKLGALLWPGATTSESRHSLATGLSVLRAKLGRERIETTRDTARLVPGTIELDLDRLARGEIHATETTTALAVAPLLHDFVVADATHWEQWRDGMRARWQPAIRDALLARIDRSRRQGNTRSMEVLADALLLLDDLSEDGVRAKMESRAFAGDRLTALQIYENWRVRLADELGAQPSDLVAGMALRLRRRGWERTSGEHIPAVRTDQWKDRPFVGRGKEYEVLYEGWEGCQRGDARHVLLTGESGIGKSTLMERLTTAAGLQGAVASRVQCHEVEREIPYGAIGALITILLEHPGANAIPPEWLSELSRTVSSVRRRFPHITPPVEATGEMVRIRLADALHELVRAITDERPLILSMDDIHLGDDASVAVLHLLLRRLTDEKVLVLCTLRQSDRQIGPSARGLLDRAELARMHVVPLPPLTDAESLDLLGQLVPGEMEPPPATVRRALLRAAAGLPMLLELLVRDWMGHGDRCVALAVQAMTEEPGAAGGAGETYRRLLDRLTGDLDPTTRSVLNLAAILGSQLNEFELYSLVDLTLPQAMSGLSQLAALRILRDGGRGLEFANEVMRGEAYFAVPSSVRKVLHSKVADRLIERQAEGEEMLGLAIAWHCVRSGRSQEAGEWLIRGGKEAISRSALAEAEEALESGLQYLPKDFRVRCRTLLAATLIDQSRFHDAAALANTVTSEPKDDETAELASLWLLATTMSTPEALNPTHGTMQRIADQVTVVATPQHRLRVVAVAASFATQSLRGADLSMASDLLDSIPLADQLLFPVRYQLLRAQLHFHKREIAEAWNVLGGMSEVDIAEGPGMQRFNVLMGIAACRASFGEYDAAVEPLRRATTLAKKAGSPYHECSAQGNLAMVFLRQGKLASALEHARAAIGVAPARDSGWVNATGVLLTAAALLEDSHSLSAALVQANRAIEEGLPQTMDHLHRMGIADALWLSGDTDSAISMTAPIFESEREDFPLGHLGRLTRWAGHLYGVSNSVTHSDHIKRALVHLARLDSLDRLEVAATALARLSLEQHQRDALAIVAEKDERTLPPPTIAMLRRLGVLPARAQY